MSKHSYKTLNLRLKTLKSQLNLSKSKQNPFYLTFYIRSRDQTKDSNEDLQNTLTELIAKNETLERDLYTKTELLKSVEEQNRNYTLKLRQDYAKL